MDSPRDTAAAFGIADYPARRVAGGDRPGAGQTFAGLERDNGDLPGRRIDLIESTLAPGIDLDRVIVALAAGLDPRG